MIIKHCTIFI